MPIATLLETSIAISDQLHDELLGNGQGEARGMIGEVLIDRLMQMDYTDKESLPVLPQGMQNLAKSAVDRAVEIDEAHKPNRATFYSLFGVEAPVYAPDEPLEVPDAPSGWPIYSPDLPLFTAA